MSDRDMINDKREWPYVQGYKEILIAIFSMVNGKLFLLRSINSALLGGISQK